MVFSEVVGTLSFLQPQADDDISDRLHYYYTTTFLLVTAVLISLKMFGGRPIECWMPAEYQHSWQEYAEMYCFSMNTYFAAMDKGIPDDVEVRKRNMVNYYIWTPFFLVISAFLFYSPCLIWRALYTKSGIRIKDIVLFANDGSNIKPKMREANIKGMSAHLSSVFRHRFRLGSKTKYAYQHRFMKLLNLRFYEAYLTLLYIGIKLLFLANVVAQTFLVNWFLQTNNAGLYGLNVLWDIVNGREWTDSGNFPRITYCDFDVRVLGNVQKHTVQCVLVINIFIEKIFVLLWIWYSFIAMVSIMSLVNWIISSMPLKSRIRFIARRLALADTNFNRRNFEQELNEFVRDYIKMDGVFVLRMLTMHAGILICTEVVDMMWMEFLASTGRNVPSPDTITLPPKFPAIKSASDADVGGGGPLSTISEIPPRAFARKSSVFVPLLSMAPRQAQLRTTPGSGTTTPKVHTPHSALPYVGGMGSALAIAGISHTLTHTIGHHHHYTRPTTLLTRPNPAKWRMERQRRIASLDDQKGLFDGMHSGRKGLGVRRNGSQLGASNRMRPRRTGSKFGAALLGAIGATLALKQQGSNSSPANIETSATMQSPFDPEASFSEEAEALIEAEEGRHDPMLGMDADDNDEYHDEEQNVISEYEGAPALEASSSARLRHPAGGGVTK